FCLMLRLHPRSTLFPYTTLFRSGEEGRSDWHHRPERRGQIDVVEDSQPDYRTDHRTRRSQRASRQPFGSWHRFPPGTDGTREHLDRKSTRLNSSHVSISYAVFCL